jgi:hypothetical protein
VEAEGGERRAQVGIPPRDGAAPGREGRLVCGIYNLQIRFTDTLRDVRTTILWQVRVFTDVDKLRPQDQERGRSCNEALRRN